MRGARVKGEGKREGEGRARPGRESPRARGGEWAGRRAAVELSWSELSNVHQSFHNGGSTQGSAESGPPCRAHSRGEGSAEGGSGARF